MKNSSSSGAAAFEQVQVIGKTRTLALGIVVAVMAALPALYTVAEPASAAEPLVVNSTGDQPDFSPTDGVCDTTDGGLSPCTLRAAIQQANATAGADAIEFQIGGPFASGVKTIKPGTFLPIIEQPVTIDGYTQPGASENTNATGAINAELRIELSGENAGTGTGGLGIRASNVVVRGLVINRFESIGVQIGSNNIVMQGNRVEGNFIGTDPSGILDRGNGAGVVIFSNGTSDNTIGGTTPAARNLISGNDAEGVRIVSSASDNRVQGNLIGTKAIGRGNLGNAGGGVKIVAPDNTIGGVTDATANTIAFNEGPGVRVDSNSADTGNRILRNSIFSNSGLGIDLLGGVESVSGETANDPQDSDTGPNNLQNKPVLSSAVSSGSRTTIKGKLNSVPDQTFTVEFFSNPSDNEGKKFLGSKSVITDANGNVSFTFKPAKKLPAGQRVTATATSASGDTSEFSAPRVVKAS